ncbi:MAG TPA: CBS domain-containing protein [Nitrospiria bacterium]|nr:CBS domain-containing protein [Nitrospiria bacterium]
MSLSEIMHTDIVSLPPTALLPEAASLMRSQKIGSVFIKEADKYVGVITEGDLVRKGLARSIPSSTSIQKLMSSPILEIDVNRSVLEANHLMHFNNIRHLAISKEGKIIGLISVRDLVRYFSGQQNGPAQSLNDIYQPLSILVHREIITVPFTASVQEAGSLLEKRKVGSLIVVEDGHYAGFLTETDLVRKVMGFGLEPTKIPVGAIMNVPIIDIDINRSISDASQMMAARGVRHLAVSEQGKIIGVLSIRDLIGMISIRDLPRFFAKKES